MGCGLYVLGGASFIPFLGLPFGIAAIIAGLVRRAWILFVLGLGGLLLNVMLCGSLFYFGLLKHGGAYDKVREQMAVTLLNNTVKEVEFYKLVHGHYPVDLSELRRKENPREPLFIIDPATVQRPGSKDGYFFYELAPDGQGYFLRGLGADGVPFTDDDLLPNLSEEERKNTGLKLAR